MVSSDSTVIWKKGPRHLQLDQFFAITLHEQSEALRWMLPTCFGEAPEALGHDVQERLLLPWRLGDCLRCMGAPAVLQGDVRRAAVQVAPGAHLERAGRGGVRVGPARLLCAVAEGGKGFDVASA